MEKVAYMIVLNDNTSGESSYVIPSMPEIKNVLYRSYPEAKKALLEIVAKFGEFVPAAYGSAYPYDNTTFEKELMTKEFALLGWVIVASEEEDEPASRIPLGLLKIAYSG
jgi:hypothetical protein